MAASPPCWWDVGLVLHTRGMVGGKRSLLSIICPTEFSSRRGAGVWLLFPWHSLEGWDCMKWRQGKGVGAALSLPGRCCCEYPPCPCSLSKGKARQRRGWAQSALLIHSYGSGSSLCHRLWGCWWQPAVPGSLLILALQSWEAVLEWQRGMLG